MKAFVGDKDRPWFLYFWLFAVTTFFLAFAGFNLSNFRPVSSDEVYMISVSYKLENQGVLGSDLLHGFFNADQHFFINLPGYHILQAIVFRIFGPGIVQARWISLGFGVLLILITTLLAYRWFGLVVAVIFSLLMLLWRSNLIGNPPGIPMLSVARSARYDIGAVALVWLAIFWLNNLVHHPASHKAFITGLIAGFASLTHFTGIFIWPFIIAVLVWRLQNRLLKTPLVYWIAFGGALVLLPYLILSLSHLTDLLGQYKFIYGNRADFISPGFYLDNLISEPERFRHMLSRLTPGPWLFVGILFPSLVYIAVRVRQRSEQNYFMLLASILAFEVSLIIIDQTKAPIYSLVLLPSLYLAIAVFLGFLTEYLRDDTNKYHFRMLAGLTGGAIMTLVLLEGGSIYLRDYDDAVNVSSYDQVGQRIRSYLGSGGHVLGAERWWWPLRGQRYTSLRNLYSQWMRDNSNSNPEVTFPDQVATNDIQVILINDNIKGDIGRYSDKFDYQFWTFVEKCTNRIDAWQDHTYGELTVHRVRSNPCSFPPDGEKR